LLLAPGELMSEPKSLAEMLVLLLVPGGYVLHMVLSCSSQAIKCHYSLAVWSASTS
jgi:hypothetical protein